MRACCCAISDCTSGRLIVTSNCPFRTVCPRATWICCNRPADLGMSGGPLDRLDFAVGVQRADDGLANDTRERHFGRTGARARTATRAAAITGISSIEKSFQGVITVLPDCHVRVVASASSACSSGKLMGDLLREQPLPIRRIQQSKARSTCRGSKPHEPATCNCFRVIVCGLKLDVPCVGVLPKHKETCAVAAVFQPLVHSVRMTHTLYNDVCAVSAGFGEHELLALLEVRESRRQS